MDLMQYEAMAICAMATILVVFAWELFRLDRDLREKENELEYYRAKWKAEWPGIKPSCPLNNKQDSDESEHHSYAA